MSSIKIEKPRLLIVEGEDENRFFNSLLSSLGIANIQVMPIGGKTKIRENLGLVRKDARSHVLESIGIVRDADDDPDSAFQSVCDSLKMNGFSVPASEFEFTNEKPRIGVVILPGNNAKGTLEDLCLMSEKDNPGMSCVEQYFECLKFKQGHVPSSLGKAKIHVFLASKIADPTKRLGEAAEAGYWNWNNESFLTLKEFLSGL